MRGEPGPPFEIDRNLCAGCKVCMKCCHVGAVVDRLYDCEIDPGICVGCGRCAAHCPQHAIRRVS